MSNNTTVPAALANTADAELQAFRTYIDRDEGSHALAAIECDHDDLGTAINQLLDSGTIDTSTIEVIDDALGHAESLVANLREIREGCVDQLGVPVAIVEVVQALRERITKPHIDALRNNFEVMWNSDRKMSRDLREALLALGMPKEYRGKALNSFRRAALGNWIDRLARDAADLAKDQEARVLSGFKPGVHHVAVTNESANRPVPQRAVHGRSSDMQDAIDGSLEMFGLNRWANGKAVRDCGAA